MNNDILLSDAGLKLENGFSFFERLKKNIIRRAEISFINFKAHLVVYASLNLLLFIINRLIPSQVPWFYFFIAGWAIGIAVHAQHVWNTKKEKEQLLPVKDIAAGQIALIRKIQKTESTFRYFRTIYIGFIVFFIGINMIAYQGFPWFVFPVLLFGAVFGAYWAFYWVKKKYLCEELAGTGILWTDIKKQKGTQYSIHSPVSEYSEKYIEAVHIKNHLLSLLESDRESGLIFALEPQVFFSDYIHRIDQLIKHDASLDLLLKDVSEEETDKTLLSLRTKSNQTDDGFLKADYEKTISQYEQTKKNIIELKKTRELIYTEVHNAITLLKQMERDLTRMKNIAIIGEPHSFTQVKQKSMEMQKYLEDLEKGFAGTKQGG
jgi:hypothetical protein